MLTAGDPTRGEGPAFQLRPESHPDKSSPARVWSWEKQQHGQGQGLARNAESRAPHPAGLQRLLPVTSPRGIRYTLTCCNTAKLERMPPTL